MQFKYIISRHSLVVKHCLGKTETMGPIPIDGSKKQTALFLMGIGRVSYIEQSEIRNHLTTW